MVYYDEFYELLRKFMDKNNIIENEDDMVHKLIQIFSVTNKEVPKKDNAQFYDP